MSVKPVAVITGGSRGIGLGIAKVLANDGFSIALTGLDAPQSNGPMLAEQGVDAFYVQSDLSDLAGHQPAVDAILGRYGHIDCLVNNAGIASVVRGDFLEMEPANFDTIVSVNLRGTIFFTQAVVKTMLRDASPENARSVVNITSVSATLSSPERLDYCVTKAGLSAFSQGLALRLAEAGIGVFEVRPGIIRSEMTAKVSTKYDAQIEAGLVPMKRWGEPADIGAIVSALASGKFGFATGSIIDADGGLSIAKL